MKRWIKRKHRETLDHTFEMEAQTTDDVVFCVRVGLAKKRGVAYINGDPKGQEHSLTSPFVEIREDDILRT